MQEDYYLPVNWVDGMKINRSHFIAQDNALVYQLAQHTSCILNELNYGVLPAGPAATGLKLFVSTDNQKMLQVRIQQCRAITAGGYYIECNEDTTLQGGTLSAPVTSRPVALKDLKKKAVQFYVVLTINPYQRVPHGAMNAAELPPRIPYTLPALFADLVPVEEVTKNVIGAFQLPVGKISIDDQAVALDEDYIPPCTSVRSHPQLLEIHAALEQFYGKMEMYALQIMQKILQKKQLNEMAGIVQKLCETILTFTASQLAELKSIGNIQPPVYMIAKAASLSRLIKNTIDCYAGSGKDELISYFTEWCTISQGELESTITSLSNHQYDHLNLNNSVEVVARFTRLLSRLFHQLSKLEYIGKRKEAGIFVKEELVKQGLNNASYKPGRFSAD